MFNTNCYRMVPLFKGIYKKKIIVLFWSLISVFAMSQVSYDGISVRPYAIPNLDKLPFWIFIKMVLNMATEYLTSLCIYLQNEISAKRTRRKFRLTQSKIEVLGGTFLTLYWVPIPYWNPVGVVPGTVQNVRPTKFNNLLVYLIINGLIGHHFRQEW